MSKLSTGLVAVFYPTVVVAAVVLLALVQFRSSGGSAFDTWRLNYNANRVLADKLDTDSKSLRKGELENLDNLNFTDLCLKFYSSDGTWRTDIDQNLLNEAKEARSSGKKYTDVQGDLYCLLRGHTQLQYDKAYQETKKKNYAEDLSELNKAIALNSDQYAELSRGHENFLAFYEMEKSNFWSAKLVAVTPYDLLVLLLVMFMGALGGMVRLLRDYGDAGRPNPNARDYLFIPLIGLVVAIGGYVLAKTGLLLLSSTREETSLSPFMIGLVGIVSGLLAREVIDAIARAGSNMMKTRASAAARTRGRSARRRR